MHYISIEQHFNRMLAKGFSEVENGRNFKQEYNEDSRRGLMWSPEYVYVHFGEESVI